MVGNSVSERHLQEAESRLRALLDKVLPACAESGANVFVNSENMPHEFRHHWLMPEADDLYKLAKMAVALRTSLGLPVVGTLAQLFLSACSESANAENPHRRGPRKLAIWLLAEARCLPGDD